MATRNRIRSNQTDVSSGRYCYRNNIMIMICGFAGGQTYMQIQQTYCSGVFMCLVAANRRGEEFNRCVDCVVCVFMSHGNCIIRTYTC